VFLRGKSGIFQKELNQIPCLKTFNQSSKEIFLCQRVIKFNFNSQIFKSVIFLKPVISKDSADTFFVEAQFFNVSNIIFSVKKLLFCKTLDTIICNGLFCRSELGQTSAQPCHDS
jgi:hypothetical protein